jgi:hypothetical protein
VRPAPVAAPAPPTRTAVPNGNGDAAPDLQPVAPPQLKEAFLEEVRKAKKLFYGVVVAQALRIEVENDRIVFVFGPHHRALRTQFEQTRPWLETAASQLAGRKMAVVASEGAAPAAPKVATASESGKVATPGEAGQRDRQQQLKQEAMADSGVQALLDVFAAEIKDVEELK